MTQDDLQKEAERIAYSKDRKNESQLEFEILALAEKWADSELRVLVNTPVPEIYKRLEELRELVIK